MKRFAFFMLAVSLVAGSVFFAFADDDSDLLESEPETDVSEAALSRPELPPFCDVLEDGSIAITAEYDRSFLESNYDLLNRPYLVTAVHSSAGWDLRFVFSNNGSASAYIFSAPTSEGVYFLTAPSGSSLDFVRFSYNALSHAFSSPVVTRDGPSSGLSLFLGFSNLYSKDSNRLVVSSILGTSPYLMNIIIDKPSGISFDSISLSYKLPVDQFRPPVPPPDPEPVRGLLSRALALNQSLYTPASYAGLMDIVQAAQQLLDGGEYTQEDLDAAFAQLQAALDDLEPLPVPEPGDPGYYDHVFAASLQSAGGNISDTILVVSSVGIVIFSVFLAVRMLIPMLRRFLFS